MNALYIDYRSDSYNEERTRFEPEYGEIQDVVGENETERNGRLANVDAILHAHAELGSIDTVLDWGGADGSFVPTALKSRQVAVLDVSNKPLVNKAFRRIDRLRQDEVFDYIQLCHVLEHVSSPRELLGRAVRHLRQDGYIYIEVPQDRSDADMGKLLSISTDSYHLIHEHLNLFTPRSVKALGCAVGLTELVVSKQEIDCGWTRTAVISALFAR